MNSFTKQIKNHSTTLFSLVTFFVVLSSIGILHTGHAHAVTDTALSSQAPMLNSGDYYKDTSYQGAYRGWFAISSGTAEAPTAWQKIYVPYNTASPTVITITNGGGYCYSKTDPNYIYGAYDSNAPLANYAIQDLDQDENMVASGGTLNTAISNLVGGTSCHDLTLTIPATAGTRSRLYGHTGFKVFFFTSQLVSSCGGTAFCTIGKIFQLNASNNGLIGFSRSVNSTTQSATSRPFGVTASPLYDLGPPLYLDSTTKTWMSPPYDWTYSFQFAPRCEEDSPASNLIVYDVDNGYSSVDSSGNTSNFNPQYLSADLYVDDRDTAGYSWVQQPGSPGPHTWSANQLGAFNVNNTLNTLTFPTSSHSRYRLHMNQFNFHNVVAFYVPLDQFDADSNFVNCFSSNCIITTIDGPTGIVNPNRKDYITPGDPMVTANTGQTIHLSIQMYNAGAGPWTYDPADPNTHFALGQRNPSSGSLIDFNKSPPPPYIIQPGETTTFDVYISSNTPTTNRYVYQMQDAGSKWFGEQCSVDINISGGPIAPLQVNCTQIQVSIGGSSVRTTTPTRVTFTDSAGVAPTVVDSFNTTLNSPDFAQKTYDPFRNGYGAQLYPHVKYNVLLEVQADSRNPSVWSSPAGGTAVLAQCLAPTCDPLGSTALEPGESTTSVGQKQSDGISLNNQTTQTFSTSIYLVKIIPSAGISGVGAYAPSNPVTSTIPPGTTDLNTSFDMTLNSPSTITASMQFDLPGATPVAAADSYYPGVLACSKPLVPVAKPYLKAFLGDVNAGGGFNSGVGAPNCTGQPGYSAIGNIKSFANSDAGPPNNIIKRIGSSADFGVFLNGLILTSAPARHGFYSGGLPLGGYAANTNPLTFANNGTPPLPSWGGLMTNPPHCIFDYYSGFSQQVLAWQVPTPSNPVPSTDSLTGYNAGAGQVNLAGNGSIQNHPTIVVNGDVFISGDMVYWNGWTWTNPTNQPPLFTLVVKGNIYISGTVGNLDGVYIAQPNAASLNGGGQIYTCSLDPATGPPVPTDLTILGACTNQLTVNGSFIAENIHYDRIPGTLRNAIPQPQESYNSAFRGAAEKFNFTPEILLATPTSTSSGGSATSPIRVDSLLSLPPVL